MLVWKSNIEPVEQLSGLEVTMSPSTEEAPHDVTVAVPSEEREEAIMEVDGRGSNGGGVSWKGGTGIVKH